MLDLASSAFALISGWTFLDRLGFTRAGSVDAMFSRIDVLLLQLPDASVVEHSTVSWRESNLMWQQ